MSGTTLTDRALLRLSGEDVRGFLQGLVTNDVDLLAPGRPLWAGLLTAQGKALFDFLLWDGGEDVLVDCEADQAEALARRLALDPDRAAQPIEGQPPREVAGRVALAVDQHVLAVGPQDEVEQSLALRAEQSRPERPLRRQRLHVLGHQPLQESAHVLAGQAKERAIGESGRGHAGDIALRPLACKGGGDEPEPGPWPPRTA